MSIKLSLDNERFLDFAVSTGIYRDRSAALDAAVELLRHRFKLIRDVNKGIDQLDRGEGRPLDIDSVKAVARREFQAG